MADEEILLACLVCLVALIFWVLCSNGYRYRQRPDKVKDQSNVSHEPVSRPKEVVYRKEVGLQGSSMQSSSTSLQKIAVEEECGTDIDRASVRNTFFKTLLQKLHLLEIFKTKLTIKDGMRVSSVHVAERENASVIENFIAKLAAYDYRVQQINLNITTEDDESNQKYSSDDWAVIDTEIRRGTTEIKYSPRDIMYAILNCVDPFFLQDVLMKLSACQIAVPVLIPNPTGNNVKFLLWGLRKIVKSWCNDKTSSSIEERTIVRHEMPTVTAMRIGKVSVSKSNILNKLLGPTQGNDEHAFFMSYEQGSSAATLSEGTLESVWFLPGNEKGPISVPFALMNLRGDYLHHSKQAKFAIRMSFVTIVFIDAKCSKTYRELIEGIRLTSHIIVVFCLNNPNGERQKPTCRTFHNAEYQLAQIVSDNSLALEISAEISKIIKDLIERKNVKVSSLEKAESSAKELSFQIDEADEDCIKARQLAANVFDTIEKMTPSNYKKTYFPLQELWKKWSENDKIKEWDSTENLEADIANHEIVQKGIRLKQATVKISTHLQTLCEFMVDGNKRRRDYLFAWLQIYLNDISAHFLKPLTKKLIAKSSERRKLCTEINKMEKKLRKTSATKEDNKELAENKLKEEKVAKEEQYLLQQFEENSLGVEHYMREFGQLVESYQYTKIHTANNLQYIKKLPVVAAEMLLHGHPIEILDGDVSHVPLVWLKEVFKALVVKMPKNATVYVISVLGIQSSGKSTLLNSMFGVRFAASAGRCTRGVFMQLLPIENKLKDILNCDYLVIVDTEGLRAPEKSLQSYTHQDNELATFALCISNLTLINIGGQTMGEDMTNVLQIAAHAFVRMTQVNLKPECRIIQQFVADVTADQKNESAMQTILMKLDEAAREAAQKEGKEHLYRQFSDVFSVQNYNSSVKNVQYIPSLWRGFMGAPNYQYSLRVQHLKSTILQSIKNPLPLTVLEFCQRIADVWNAIKKEDFVFSFQNTKEVSLYQEITSYYRSLIQPIRQEVIEMELSARNSIENAKPEKIDEIIDKNLNEIRTTLRLRCQDVHEKLKFKCREQKYDSVRKYSKYFETDLQVLQGRTESSVSSTFSRFAAITKAAHKKDSVLQNLSAEIRDKFVEFAQTLRRQTEELLSGGSDADDVNNIINEEFEKQWKLRINDVQKRYPLRSLKEITNEIRDTVTRSINDGVQNSVLSMEALNMLKGDINVYSSQPLEISTKDIEDLKLLFCRIDDRSENFETLCLALRKIGENVEELEENIPKALEKIKTYMDTTDFVKNENFILLYIVCSFLMHAHRSQQRIEWKIVSQTESALSEICKKLQILEEHEIKPKLISFIIEAIPEQKLPENLKTELNELSDDIVFSPGEKDKHTIWDIMMQKMRLSEDSDKVLSDLYVVIKSELTKCLDAHYGKCSVGVVRRFAKILVTHCLDKKIPSKLRKSAIKYSFKVAELFFIQTLYENIYTHIHSGEYQMKFAPPLTLSSVEKKVKTLLTLMDETFPSAYMNFMKEELHEGNIFKVEALPRTFPLLEKLDFHFLKILPILEKDDLEFILSEIQNVKTLILTTAKNKATFYAGSFAQHVQDIVDKTDKKLANNVRAAAVVHIGAWSLPIYARRQFDFEKQKNVAVLIQSDKKLFETEFKSLASNCQDAMIAERFVETVERALKEGLLDILYPRLYLSILNDQSEFRNKKKFIGSVVKNLFENENISGISNFFLNFPQYSKIWILDLVAKKIQDNRIWLENHVADCAKSLAASTKQTILEMSKQYQTSSGESFSDILDSFSDKFKCNTKLTCKNDDIEKLKRYLKVNDSRAFLKKCDELAEKLEKCMLDFFESFTLDEKDDIKSWLLNSLPKGIHSDVFDSFKGCDEQCPFCGTVCDEDLTKHPMHNSLCHLPSGVTGWHDHHSDKLSSFTCVSAVGSTLSYKTRHGNPEWRPYKEYEKDYPHWKIRPSENNDPFVFWKHLFATYNEKFAHIHGRKKADIPPPWLDIERETALESLCEIYILDETETQEPINENPDNVLEVK